MIIFGLMLLNFIFLSKVG